MFRKSVEVTAVATRPFDDSPTAWMADGNCRNYAPAVFFPSDGVGVDRARAICKGCPVTGTCLEYALENRIEHGVWGGCSERERPLPCGDGRSAGEFLGRQLQHEQRKRAGIVRRLDDPQTIGQVIGKAGG